MDWVSRAAHSRQPATPRITHRSGASAFIAVGPTCEGVARCLGGCCRLHDVGRIDIAPRGLEASFEPGRGLGLRLPLWCLSSFTSSGSD